MNLTLGHICPCVFDTYQEACKDVQTRLDIIKCEEATSIEREISKWINNGSPSLLYLTRVVPNALEEYFDSFETEDMNGWQGDYWAIATKGKNVYNISGCSWYGNCSISLKK